MNDIATWIAIVSAIIALIATWYAAQSTKIAQKALHLALQQERRQHPNLELYLIDSHAVRFRDQHFRVYVFHIRITNNSDADNSLADIALIIEHSRAEKSKSILVVSHDQSIATELAALKNTPVQVPSKVEAHETIAGYALFRVQDELLSNSAVQEYILRVIDGHGIESEMQPIFVKEYDDEGPD